MKYTRVEMKLKAIEILKAMHVPKHFIEAYDKSDIVPYFSHGMKGYEEFARNYLKENKEKILARYGECYAISLDIICGCPMLSFLCYSPWKEDSEFMFTTIYPFYFRVYAYVHNFMNEDFSEYGSIVVAPFDDGIQRIE